MTGNNSSCTNGISLVNMMSHTTDLPDSKLQIAGYIGVLRSSVPSRETVP